MHETYFPLGARPVVILLVFVALLIVFDLILVRWLKLGKVAWKRVDYIWLSVAAVGLLGSSVEARRLIAQLSVPARDDDRTDAYERLKQYAEDLRGSAVCRTFQRTELSPPNLDDMQAEYNLVCAYGRRVASALPVKPPEHLNDGIFGTRPRVTDDLLKRHYEELDETRSGFAVADGEYDRTRSIAEQSNFGITIALLSPILIAVALALRITKVTGEIALDMVAAETKPHEARTAGSVGEKVTAQAEESTSDVSRRGPEA